MKRVSFSLSPEQTKQYKSLVEASLQSRILRNYTLNEYRLPDDLSVYHANARSGLKPFPFHFDEFTDERINALVTLVREQGFKVNRSSLMSHILDELIEKLSHQAEDLPKARDIRHSSFYFERGTREVIERLIPFRDRNSTIERFIIEEYQPRQTHSVLFEKPVDPESFRVSIAADAFNKLDRFVNETEVKGLTRTALMRDVIEQLIAKLSNADARKLIAEVRLKHALEEYKIKFGEDVLQEQLQPYITKKEEF
ncbi:hypothetical protein [Jeotgalibacillus terrae]|uniref:Uncharacterized protein n=1 Tax=Jeotgalibacillus terrae TaxID=587735 RepID=A0ABW5ZKH0_9BACL|nr:hypothetical protein [Jeotgalibacillus terrae]MBM7580818.1 hypothetical protein [Jeotgalibacillus terrae]